MNEVLAKSLHLLAVLLLGGFGHTKTNELINRKLLGIVSLLLVQRRGGNERLFVETVHLGKLGTVLSQESLQLSLHLGIAVLQ